MKVWFVALMALSIIFVMPVQAKPIGFIEKFSLAKDRAKVLEHLIPGTEDYYFYHCLHAQHTGDFETVRRLCAKWIERYGYTARLKEIQNRQALLDYEKNPDQSLDYIKKNLGLKFNHQKEKDAQKPDLPSRLDAKLISAPYLMSQAFSRYRNLDGIEKAGLDILNFQKLNPERRRHLLARLQRPDVPGLAKLVVADLKHKHSQGFGAFSIHSQLLKSQLDECIQLMPNLLKNNEFVSAYISKLAPDSDTNIEDNFKEKKAYLERVWNFVKGLDPVYNSLKTHALYHLLDFYRSQGNYDQKIFMDYIKLPKSVSYIKPEYVRRNEFRHVKANLNANFNETRFWGFGPIHTDEELVKDYLAHFFISAKNYSDYSSYIKEAWLKKVFAETKMLNGIGDMEQWYSMMPPDYLKNLKERTDIIFSKTNPLFFNIKDTVQLSLEIKNVQNLIIKIFEINSFNYYQSKNQEINTAINLDGLTATWEKVINYDAPALRRMTRKFEFPEINKPGAYAVEFIGNGKSSRALIRKGKLYFTETISSAGHEFTIFDETRKKCSKASLWLAGHHYSTDEDGVIIVPFSTNPKDEKIILQANDRCSLGIFSHLAETYHLNAKIYVDGESLIQGQNARVIVRPCLSLNSQPVSLSLLENINFEMNFVDQDGVSITRTMPNFKVFEDKDSVFEFQVPEKIRKMTFTLKAQVKNLSMDKKQDIFDQTVFSINKIDASQTVQNAFLRHVNGVYMVDVLGKNGEIKPDTPVYLKFKHKYFKDVVNISLKTDSNGRVLLSSLNDIEWLEAELAQNTVQRWHPSAGQYNYPNAVHALADTGFRVAYAGDVNKTPRLHFSLLEKRGKTYLADWLKSLAFRDGFLEIIGLPKGDYELFLKNEGRSIAIRVTAGRLESDFFMSDHRMLEADQQNPMQIASVKANKKNIEVQLVYASNTARVHVVATRFAPSFDLFANLAENRWPVSRISQISKAHTHYIAMRDIGDEYRYVLDRKYAQKFPGNMLARPEILLNPWSLRKTETSHDYAKDGEAPQSMSDDLSAWGAESLSDGVSLRGQNRFANFDFLKEGSVSFLNLKPDKTGLLVIDRSKLKNCQQIHILAIDQGYSAYQEISLPENSLEKQDIRMARSLDPKIHFAEQKQISLINTGKIFNLKNPTESKFEIYDSLEKIYQIFLTLNNNDTLKEFGFILNWPDMSAMEKQKKYSKYACHELNFFLYHKDNEFFKRVIQPYLSNKKDKTFMDHWLLGHDLSAYKKDWAFGQLNLVEKILLMGRGADKSGPYVRKYFELLPPDPDTYNRLFNTALKGRAFEKDSYALADMDEEAGGEIMAGVLPDEKIMMEMEAAPMAAPEPQAVRMMKSMSAPRKEAKNMRRKKALQKRKKIRRFYQKLDKTEEWAENNYYHLSIAQQNKDLISVNAFWNDYAGADNNLAFMSTNFLYAAENFTEMMLALSVLDLPFKAKNHETSVKDKIFSLKAASPIIVFHKEIQAAKTLKTKIPIVAGQNFFKTDDRYYYEHNQTYDKFVDGEFLYGTAYGCQVVLSNPSASPRKLRVLMQIPQGAVGLSNGFYSKSTPVHIKPYGTWAFEYYFYFPEPGNFQIYPVQVSQNEAFVTSASLAEFNVVKKFSQVDTESWPYISQNGTNEQILDYIRTNNPHRINLDKIAFRMKDQAFFTQCLSLLRSLHIFSPTLWSYGIFHNVPDIISEFLKYSSYADQCGLLIKSPLLSINPVARKTYEHLEYKPLVNARAHQLGKDRKILNDRFFDQYERFLKKIGYQPALAQDDFMAVVYYLLVQDRVGEAMAFFKKIDLAKVKTRIQYDYLQVYLDFYGGNLERARHVALRYSDYAVDRWQKLFRTALVQMDELAGKALEIADEKDRNQVHAHLADTAPSFDFSIESRHVTLNFQNIKSCKINYYPMEIELLFSRNPFVKQQSREFALIRPRQTKLLDIPKNQTQLGFDIPEKFHNSNLMVEIVAEGIKKSQAYYANSLNVQVMETYGHLRAAHQKTGKPLPKTYIKVYARMKNKSVKFYKDGYTDLRGRFDYASLSTDELNQVEKFALLIFSDTSGAVIKEASPPKQ